MAIVFISPKQRQKKFFFGIGAGLALFVLFVALSVFLSKPPEASEQFAFNKPKVSVNLELLQSEMLKNLEPWLTIKFQYDYTAFDTKGRDVAGRISAYSMAEARQLLEDQNLSVETIKESKFGRENPFLPFYK